MGDHKKCVGEDGKNIYKLGVVFFMQCTRNKSQFKKGEECWLVDTADFVKMLDKPKEEKVTGRHWTYYFKDVGNV